MEMGVEEKPVFETNLPPDKAKKLVEVLREVYDPEIPINVYDLGLIRKIVMENGKVKVVMTLTAVGCPLTGQVAEAVGYAVQSALPEAEDIEVEIDFEKPWDPTQMTPQGREMFKAIYGYDIVEQYLQANAES